MRLSPPGTHFTAESTEAMQIKSLAQGENILMLGIVPSIFVSKIDILTTTPIVHIISYQVIVNDLGCVKCVCYLIFTNPLMKIFGLQMQ